MGAGGYGPTIVGVMWVETAIALVFVCLRLWTRFKITRTAGWDDYLIIVSWVRNTLQTSNYPAELWSAFVDAVYRCLHIRCLERFW